MYIQSMSCNRQCAESPTLSPNAAPTTSPAITPSAAPTFVPTADAKSDIGCEWCVDSIGVNFASDRVSVSIDPDHSFSHALQRIQVFHIHQADNQNAGLDFWTQLTHIELRKSHIGRRNPRQCAQGRSSELYARTRDKTRLISMFVCFSQGFNNMPFSHRNAVCLLRLVFAMYTSYESTVHNRINVEKWPRATPEKWPLANRYRLDM